MPKREDMTAAADLALRRGEARRREYCRAFAEVYGLETVSRALLQRVRSAPGSPLAVCGGRAANFIASLLHGEPPDRSYGDGEQSRDFTYVENVVEANVLSASAPDAAGRVYNVACGESVTLNELFAQLSDLLGSDVAPIYSDPRPGDVRHSLADISAARHDLGYEPAVLLREGLSRTIEHLREELAARAGIAHA